MKAEKEGREKFPSPEELQESAPDDTEHANIFTGRDSGIFYVGSGDTTIICARDYTFEPQLGMKLHDGTFLEAGLHNGAMSTFSLPLFQHGLHALRKIYRAFDLEYDFLPEVGFREEGVHIRVPTPHRSSEEYTGLTVSDTGIEGLVPLTASDDPHVRCQTAIDLLVAASQDSLRMYIRGE